MMKHSRKAFLGILIVVILFTQLNSVQAADLEAKITNVVSAVVCGFYNIFLSIATGIAALVMIIAGIKWIGSENDPGARKAAKDAMIHAIVGLIIILIIGNVIDIVVSAADPGSKITKLC